jgi:AraC-like DNA-binding protein
MDANFLQIAEIKEVAEHCNMSEYHFFRRFKEVYKKTPYQYITEQKMQLAKTMLLQKEHSVSDIAILCSFPDIFTFSKAFKKFFGVPPSMIR